MDDTVSPRQQSARPAKSSKSSAAHRPPTSAKRTGARATPKKATPRSGSPASKKGGKPSLASAKEFAYRPYADKMAAATPASRPRPTSRQVREASKERRTVMRERRKLALFVPGLPAIVRGGWPGFVVLLVGNGVAAVFGGAITLIWVAIIAYAVAGNRAAAPSGADTRRAVRDGALSAVMAYAFTLPIVYSANVYNSNYRVWPATFQGLFALLIGALAALIASRARRRAGATGVADA